MMVPSGDITEASSQELLNIADEGDTIVDGRQLENSATRSVRNKEAYERGLQFVVPPGSQAASGASRSASA